LVPLQNPAPENPAWLESIVPEQTDGDVSASYRVVAAAAEPGASKPVVPAISATMATKDLDLIIYLQERCASRVVRVRHPP
jgi:hypothetical protein